MIGSAGPDVNGATAPRLNDKEKTIMLNLITIADYLQTLLVGAMAVIAPDVAAPEPQDEVSFACDTPMETDSVDGSLAAPVEPSLDDNCFYPSSCDAFWAGKCEDYCGDRGFSHMTGDGCDWPTKKCCCIVP